jgi:hypothetical protein
LVFNDRLLSRLFLRPLQLFLLIPVNRVKDVLAIAGSVFEGLKLAVFGANTRKYFVQIDIAHQVNLFL